jgi:hypothetical protein
MVGRLKSESGTTPACLSFMYAALTRAAALLADWPLCRKYLRLCREAIASDAAYAPPSTSSPSGGGGGGGAEDGSSDEGGERSGEPSRVVAQGGKRAWGEASGAREESLQVRAAPAYRVRE